MASDQNTQAGPAPPQSGGKSAAAGLARELVRSAWKATLASVARSGGHPYGSLVALATEPDGAPLLLLSGLAEHTQNIVLDQRISVLIDGTSAGPAALTGPRVTLVGRIAKATSETARRRYLARHPHAAGFIDFADFRMYVVGIEWAHLVAGFGRIVRLDAADVTVPIGDAGDLIAAEPGILQHMNEDHADALDRMAQRALAERHGADSSGVHIAPGAWRMCSCDPEGFDLVAGSNALRLSFPQRVTTPDAVRRALVAMAQTARASDGSSEGKSRG